MEQTNANAPFTLEIDALAYGPEGIGRRDGQVIMVPGTVPGDVITARVVEAKRRFAIGAAVAVLRPSAERRTPPCPYVTECGGCPWQQVAYRTQLAAKEKNVDDALRRIGKLSGFERLPILASPQEYHYRRRLRLQRSGNRLGFFAPGSHALVAVDECLIAGPAINAVFIALRRWIGDLETSVHQIEVVSGDGPGELVVIARSSHPPSGRDHLAADRLMQLEPGIRGVVLTGSGIRRAWGDPIVTVRTEEDLVLRVPADVFTQINPDGNRVLVREVMAAGCFTKADRVLELFAGCGNLTLSIARRAGAVVAIEKDRTAVDYGRQSARRQRMANVEWVVAAVAPALRRLIALREHFSTIVLDPPRAGIKNSAPALASLGAERIVYISCDPATLARDLAALAARGYRLARVRPIDLFPQTFHVETVALMTR